MVGGMFKSLDTCAAKDKITQDPCGDKYALSDSKKSLSKRTFFKLLAIYKYIEVCFMLFFNRLLFTIISQNIYKYLHIQK